ncbi:MAG: 3-deoxy-manno-octulosonate cytidylyltransferase [Phycisphaerales bacterium]|nr:3-deoxy-manno-octulosonate cytidylyltransferase [Phycisphaerales bacterium]
MSIVAVIPARFASSRLPGKPLLRETGKYLIQHVWELALQARGPIHDFCVATDDSRVLDAVKTFGGKAVLTRADHPSGTDRVAEVARALNLAPRDWVINIQGDEPEIDPGALIRLASTLAQRGEDPAAEIFTLASRFSDDGPRRGPGSPADPNCVKVVVDVHSRALYFSRSLTPYPRATQGEVDRASRWLLHLGVYAYRADVLMQITDRVKMPPSSLEEAESLEQLRWLENGRSIFVLIVDPQAPGIDTPEDYAAFVRRAKGK